MVYFYQKRIVKKLEQIWPIKIWINFILSQHIGRRIAAFRRRKNT